MKKLLLGVFCLGITACSGNNKSQTEKNEAPIVDSIAAVSSTSSVSDLESFSKTLTWNDYQFNVSVKGKLLHVTMKSKTMSKQIEESDLTGYSVSGSEVGDLNTDGRPEVLIFLTSEGSGSYGLLIGYSVSKDDKLLMLELPDLTLDKKNSKGYMGHDSFSIVEGTLVRAFPIYQDGDSNANPTGGTRQIQYKLPKTNGATKLVVDRVSQY